MLQPNEIGRNDRGAEVCRRVRKIAVEDIPGDPGKGHHYIDAYCNKPVIISIAEGGKTCPECEKPPVVGWASPKVTNSAAVKLTQKELEQCGVTEDTSLNPAPVRNNVEAKAVGAKVAEIKKDEVVLSIPLKELEGNDDVAAFLIKKVIEGFGTLPTSNYAESKRIMKLEEKLEALVRV